MSRVTQSQSKPVSSVVLVYGDDGAAIASKVAQVRKQVLDSSGGESMAAFNHERFDAPFLGSLEPVFGACRQAPMMAARRLVELSSPEELGKHKKSEAGNTHEVGGGKSKEQSIQMLVDYFAEPCDSTVLLVSSSGLNGTSKIVKSASATSSVQVFKCGSRDDEEAVRDLQKNHKSGVLCSISRLLEPS